MAGTKICERMEEFISKNDRFPRSARGRSKQERRLFFAFKGLLHDIRNDMLSDESKQTLLDFLGDIDYKLTYNEMEKQYLKAHYVSGKDTIPGTSIGVKDFTVSWNELFKTDAYYTGLVARKKFSGFNDIGSWLASKEYLESIQFSHLSSGESEEMREKLIKTIFPNINLNSFRLYSVIILYLNKYERGLRDPLEGLLEVGLGKGTRIYIKCVLQNLFINKDVLCAYEIANCMESLNRVIDRIEITSREKEIFKKFCGLDGEIVTSNHLSKEYRTSCPKIKSIVERVVDIIVDREDLLAEILYGVDEDGAIKRCSEMREDLQDFDKYDNWFKTHVTEFFRWGMKRNLRYNRPYEESLVKIIKFVRENKRVPRISMYASDEEYWLAKILGSIMGVCKRESMGDDMRKIFSEWFVDWKPEMNFDDLDRLIDQGKVNLNYVLNGGEVNGGSRENKRNKRVQNRRKNIRSVVRNEGHELPQIYDKESPNPQWI